MPLHFPAGKLPGAAQAEDYQGADAVRESDVWPNHHYPSKKFVVR